MTLQEFNNKYFYQLFIITLLFGIVFYDIIGYNSSDEICGLILLILFFRNMFLTKDWPINKLFSLVLGLFFFYVCYSIKIGSNSTKAIFMDFIIQMKPYLAFFCTYQLMPKFNDNQKKLLQDICIVLWFVFLPFGIIGFVVGPRFFNQTPIGHPSCYAASIAALSLTYLYCSKYTFKEKIIFLIMLAVGISSARSKFYGFFALSIFSIFYMGKIENLKFNFRNMIASLFLLAAIIFVARDKIDLYFVQGLASTENAEENDLLARFALYSTSILILIDYLPFGSGLASFGTHASAVYYSNIYTKYGIDSVWGLSKSYNKFIADTYYPSLAQFGIVGLILFVLFWIHLIRKSIRYCKKTNDSKLLTITCLIIGYMLIENIADASFTSNRGLFMMIFLGLVAANQKEQANNIEKNKAIIKE